MILIVGKIISHIFVSCQQTLVFAISIAIFIFKTNTFFSKNKKIMELDMSNFKIINTQIRVKWFKPANLKLTIRTI